MRTRSIYSALVKFLLFLALITLTMGGVLILFDSLVGYEFIRLGLWMLIVTPLIPIISISVESIRNRDIMLLTVALIIITIILANLAIYGFGKIPFLTLLPLPLLPLLL